MAEAEAKVLAESKEWTLDPETEYRFELDPGTSIAVKLLHGHAEVFGAELAEGKTYLFGSECKAAIFTWQGCTLEMSGRPSTEYVSEETPMTAYANLHIAFEQMRVRALSSSRNSPPPDNDEDYGPPYPPRVMILGPENSGKTTVAKILVNYAVRVGQGWTPLFVNLDPSEGGWSSPGALSTSSLDSPVPTSSPATVLGSVATSAPMALSSHALVPLVYWYGHAETKRNPLFMERLMRIMGSNVNEKYDYDPEGRAAGIIVDTPSSFATGTPEQRQRLIKAVVDAFEINVILVVGHERFNVEMQRAYGSQLTVVKIPKSGGVVELDQSYRDRIHQQQLHNYFYGQVIPPPAGLPASAIPSADGGELLSDLVLSPSSVVLNFKDLKIYRIGAESMAPSSALPIGAARVLSEMQPVLIDPAQPGSGLLNAVLAVMAVPTRNTSGEEDVKMEENESSGPHWDEELLDATVAGFIVITSLDMPNEKMTVLSPNKSSIVGKTAIVGSFEWADQ